MNSKNQAVPANSLSRQDISLFRGGLVSLALAACGLIGVAQKSLVLSGFALAALVFVFPFIFLLSLLQLIRHHRNWRLFAAMFLSLAAGITAVLFLCHYVFFFFSPVPNPTPFSGSE